MAKSIKCPECRKRVLTSYDYCPRCGASFQEIKQEMYDSERAKTRLLFYLILILGGIWFLVFLHKNELLGILLWSIVGTIFIYLCVKFRHSIKKSATFHFIRTRSWKQIAGSMLALAFLSGAIWSWSYFDKVNLREAKFEEKFIEFTDKSKNDLLSDIQQEITLKHEGRREIKRGLKSISDITKAYSVVYYRDMPEATKKTINSLESLLAIGMTEDEKQRYQQDIEGFSFNSFKGEFEKICSPDYLQDCGERIHKKVIEELLSKSFATSQLDPKITSYTLELETLANKLDIESKVLEKLEKRHDKIIHAEEIAMVQEELPYYYYKNTKDGNVPTSIKDSMEVIGNETFSSKREIYLADILSVTEDFDFNAKGNRRKPVDEIYERVLEKTINPEDSYKTIVAPRLAPLLKTAKIAEKEADQEELEFEKQKEESTQTKHEYESFICATDEVETHLFSPSSANFPTYWVNIGGDIRVIAHGGERYTVSSYVDSQNLLGAEVRSRFSCEVKYISMGSCLATCELY